MSGARKELDYFSWVYVILAGLTCLLIIPCFVFPETSVEMISKRGINIGNMKATTLLTITYIIEAVLFLLYFWFLRRIVKKKSKGTVLIVLLILGIVFGFVGQFDDFSISTLISMFVDIYVLQLIYRIKQEG